MKLYLLSLGAGVLVGLIYALINVRSPAPPLVALVGLLGILAGEQIPATARQLWRRDAAMVTTAPMAPAPHGQAPTGPAATAPGPTPSQGDPR